MLESKFEPAISVALTEGTVLTVAAPANVERKVVLVNLDSSNTLTWRWQWSDNNSNWTDVDTDDTLAPGATAPVSVLSGHLFYRLRASGNLTIAVKVDAELPLVNATISFYAS